MGSNSAMFRPVQRPILYGFIATFALISLAGRGWHLLAHHAEAHACCDAGLAASHAHSACGHEHTRSSWVYRDTLSGTSTTASCPSDQSSDSTPPHDEHDCSVCAFFMLAQWHVAPVEIGASLPYCGTHWAAATRSPISLDGEPYLARSPPLSAVCAL